MRAWFLRGNARPRWVQVAKGEPMIILVLSAASLILLVFSWYAMLAIGNVGLLLIALAFITGVASWVFGHKELKRDPNSSEGRIGRLIGIFVTIVAPVSLGVIVYAFYLAYGA